MRRNFVTKITPKGIGLTKEVLDKVATENQDQPVSIMRVAGRILSTKDGQNDLGPYTKFIGEFEAVNILSQDENLKVFRATSLVLTGLGEMVVLDAYNSARAKIPEGAVEVVFDIGIEYNAASVSRGGRAYKFTVNNLLGSEPSSDDALTKLMGVVGELPAPKKGKGKGKEKA